MKAYKPKKALDRIIHKEMAEYNRRHANEIDAIILRMLHTEFGFGHKRLERAYKTIVKGIKEMNERYDSDYEDIMWVNTKWLKDYGIDIEQWNKELEEESNNEQGV